MTRGASVSLCVFTVPVPLSNSLFHVFKVVKDRTCAVFSQTVTGRHQRLHPALITHHNKQISTQQNVGTVLLRNIIGNRASFGK